MIITTEYITRTIITTDDSGARTVTRTHRADTETAFLFSELSPEAQERAIAQAIEEENDSDNWYCSQTYFAEEEIWYAARDFEKQQPIRIYTDLGGSPNAEPRGKRLYYDAWEEVTEATDTGICYSMDICDAWNTYVPRIIALQEAIEDIDEMSERVWSAYGEFHFEAQTTDDDAERERLEAIYRTASEEAAQIDVMRDSCVTAAEELTEEAARAVGDTVDGLIEAERSYYQSREFWREWLNDSDDRYTRTGERI